MKSKKVMVPLIALLLLGLVAKFVLAKPAPEGEHKIHGSVYVLPKEFLLNLDDGRYAKLAVALVLAPGQPSAPAAGGHEAAAEPPEGFGTLEQEAAVRDVVTDVVTDKSGEDLVSGDGRRRIKREILAGIRARTDVKVNAVLLPDVAVQ